MSTPDMQTSLSYLNIAVCIAVSISAEIRGFYDNTRDRSFQATEHQDIAGHCLKNV